jgi:hypothetical protein
MGCMVDHIHLDKNNMQLFINYSFDSDCVHIYVNKLI